MTDKAQLAADEARINDDGDEHEQTFQLDRRTFVQVLSTGLLITVTHRSALAQRRGQRDSGGARSVAARLQLQRDGTVQVMTGKVEEGQGARAELSQAAAEELRVPVDRIQLIMADTALVPDDGITAGSRTTPGTVPSVRSGAAAARELLQRAVASQWGVDPQTLQVQGGTISHAATKRSIGYGELAQSADLWAAFQRTAAGGAEMIPQEQWQVIGSSVPRPNLRELVTGQHRFPSDIVRPNMLYGKVLRPPAYGATLQSIDLAPAEAMDGVIVVRDGSFIGFAAPTTFRAQQALDAVAATASWSTVEQVSSNDVFTHLRERAGRGRPREQGDVDRALQDADKKLSASYEVAYVQHAPMEPRAATAEWADGKLTVWTGVDGPQRVQGDLARSLSVPTDRVRVVVPDMGGGFGGKHSGEAALEAAMLAKACGRPVAVHWTRAEEFMWAYFRPAAVIDCQGGLDGQGQLVAWDFTNINAGGAAIDSPYAIPNTRISSVSSDSPLRQGAYRGLAATANNYARESFIDELASAAGADPYAFRMAHLQNSRIRKVLEVAVREFQWEKRRADVTAQTGVGLACGTEKNSVVAACVAVTVDRQKGEIVVNEVCEAFECGPIFNPANLTSQIQGCITMGLGPALREAVRFADGKIRNGRFAAYRVPRFEDLPNIDVHLVRNDEIPSAGAGETPMIAVAPAIGNAVFAATGLRLRSMPMRLPPA